MYILLLNFSKKEEKFAKILEDVMIIALFNCSIYLQFVLVL